MENSPQTSPPPLPSSPLPLEMVACAGLKPLTVETEALLRQRIVTEAMSWIGTPYRQLGATKGVAIDCSMLLVRVMIEAGIVEEFDPRPYPPTWFLHREDERYIDWMSTVCTEVSEPRSGDIDVMRFGRAFAHSGFIVDEGHLVHAFADERKCTLTPRSHPFLKYADRRGTLREHRYFDPLGKFR